MLRRLYALFVLRLRVVVITTFVLFMFRLCRILVSSTTLCRSLFLVIVVVRRTRGIFVLIGRCRWREGWGVLMWGWRWVMIRLMRRRMGG